jgi:hypothetical protein
MHGPLNVRLFFLELIDVACNVCTALLEMSHVMQPNKIFRIMEAYNAMNTREINFACGWCINLA